MYFKSKFVLYNIIVVIYTEFGDAQNTDFMSNILEYADTDIKVIESDMYFLSDKLKNVQQDTVQIKLYYECLCPDCILFDTKQLVPVVQKLSQYLDIHPYPYGNAKTKQHNGQYEFICQHGPAECYGNKLHACAIDILRNNTEAVFYNSCMMEPSQQGRGSDDLAADVCGKSMNINSEPIKNCAKSDRGTQLLKYYGDESKKVNYKYVPYILVNGVLSDGTNFLRDVCTAFKNPPKPCIK